MSKTRLYVHVVFATKSRQNTLPLDYKRELYAYIYGIITEKDCRVIWINGIENHTHILLDLSPTIALADLVKSVKQSSSRWLKNSSKFPHFAGWAEGYFAGSISPSDVEACKSYIKNQEPHHKVCSITTEIEDLSRIYSLEFYPNDWI